MTIRELIEIMQKVNNQDAPVTVALSYKCHGTALKIEGLTDWGRFVCIDTEEKEAEDFIDCMKNTQKDKPAETARAIPIEFINDIVRNTRICGLPTGELEHTLTWLVETWLKSYTGKDVEVVIV